MPNLDRPHLQGFDTGPQKKEWITSKVQEFRTGRIVERDLLYNRLHTIPLRHVPNRSRYYGVQFWTSAPEAAEEASTAMAAPAVDVVGDF
jgi:hypothetical protein